ncbi:hypothetical protein QBC46DRAFT_389868, partial [Diplogelasinospora grovesii]
YSKIRYTCDEFPPASWVEGGDGEDSDQPAQTRCAAMRCQAGVKAEQDWQATAHNKLRAELQRVIEERGSFSTFSKTDSVVFFKFYQYNTVDGIAARVWTYDETATATVPYQHIDIKQGFKRGENAGNSTANPHLSGLWGLSFEELRDLMNAGVGTEHIISANDSFVDWAASTQMPVEMQMLDKRFRWDMEDDDYEDLGNLTNRHVEPEPKKLHTRLRPSANDHRGVTGLHCGHFRLLMSFLLGETTLSGT